MRKRLIMEQVYSVTQVNKYIKGMLSMDPNLQIISVRGEVSNCSTYPSGHIYFTLKDEGGRISCVMFAGNRRGLDFILRDGMSVICIGQIGVYERDGKYQLYVSRIFREGYGELYERLEMLKKKLSDEGLFDDKNKKKIPYYSGKIGIVTASEGAAIRDIVNISNRRNPYVSLILCPSSVQGVNAAGQIARGIRRLDKLGLDVIIVGRGGGSFEDLFAFNEEEVVRAIFECNTPIISAVGHEVDTTLSDYAADMRAPTPSAAAELAVRSLDEIYKQLDIFANSLRAALKQKNVSAMNYCMTLEDKLETLMNGIISEKKHLFSLYLEKLKLLSPLYRLSGGYSYVRNDKNEAIRSVAMISEGDNIKVSVADGDYDAVVSNIRPGGKEINGKT